jgi:hypothetical protein
MKWRSNAFGAGNHPATNQLGSSSAFRKRPDICLSGMQADFSKPVPY